MEILGIGPLELLFILIIALIVLGPNDMVKAGRTLGRLMRKVVTSPTWRTLQDASREMRNLPNRMMREAGIEELQNQLPNARQLSKELGTDQLKAEMASMGKDLTVSTGPAPTIKPPEPPPMSVTEAPDDASETAVTYSPEDIPITEDTYAPVSTQEDTPSIPASGEPVTPPDEDSPTIDSPEPPGTPPGPD